MKKKNVLIMISCILVILISSCTSNKLTNNESVYNNSVNEESSEIEVIESQDNEVIESPENDISDELKQDVIDSNSNRWVHKAIIVLRLDVDDDSLKMYAPSLQLDTDNFTFVFNIDILSSYLAIGSFDVEENLIVCKTKENKIYKFKIIDDDTVEFLRDESSELNLVEDKFGLNELEHIILDR